MRTQRTRSEANIYHIVARGSGRQLIFDDAADRVHFLETLENNLDASSVQMYAWCLMGNHVHLLLKGPMDAISTCMKNTLSSYAQYFNAKSGRTGHLFQGRFKSEPIDSDEYLLTVACYIHNNPVKAGLASAERYRWSSYREYMVAPRYCETDFILSLCSGREGFARLHSILVDAKCIDIEESEAPLRVASDASAREIAQNLLGSIALNEVKTLESSSRRKVILAMKRAGLSVRQIERLTGIGRNTVQRIK